VVENARPAGEAVRAYLFIALGGALGSVLRFFLSSVMAQRFGGHAFLGTMFVNVTGSLVIGFIAALGPIRLWEQLLMIGLLGGYTTFSSFSLQTLELMHQGRWSVAFTNAFGSLALCLVAVWIGHLAGGAFRR
jgi:CrcB protein